jgi:hypothetical protein
MLKKQDQLRDRELKLVNNHFKQCPEIKTAYQLTTRFKEIMEEQKGSFLQKWIDKVVASGIGEMKVLLKDC